VKPFLILSPGKPTIRLHMFCSGLLGHLEMTMSPFSNLCNLTDIRSRSNTSLVYNVGSMDGPLHCNYISNRHIIKTNIPADLWCVSFKIIILLLLYHCYVDITYSKRTARRRCNDNELIVNSYRIPLLDT
jgi:hypothetical protein